MVLGFGLGGISPWSLLIILVIVVVIFGTKMVQIQLTPRNKH